MADSYKKATKIIGGLQEEVIGERTVRFNKSLLNEIIRERAFHTKWTAKQKQEVKINPLGRDNHKLLSVT